MSCEWAQTMVHGYSDGELDAVRAGEFERHLERCADCQASLERIESLRRSLRESDLYERASAGLRARVSKNLPMREGRRRLPFLFQGSRAPVSAALLAAAAVAIAWLVIPPRASTQRITAELIDAHVRSLQPGHLTDVESTDQHTVKPWFDGKLPFIPPVVDYASQGFPLVGGRLDVVDGHEVAALVYSRRKHTINLFAWPAGRAENLGENSGARQGYNWTAWRAGDMQFFAVSDASKDDLDALQQLMRH